MNENDFLFMAMLTLEMNQKLHMVPDPVNEVDKDIASHFHQPVLSLGITQQ